jgi:CelD/BcsL family acetyltransferase involved in cellulose biosynthesis
VARGLTVVRVGGVEDFTALGARWRDLEQRADGSFFQSWTWVGCLCAERFPDPVLVEASEAGHIVALGLFNRVRHRIGPSTLYLNETGTAAFDCPYVEQNGILTEAGREQELTALCLRQLVRTHDVVLSGVGEQVLAAFRSAAGVVLTGPGKASPFVDLAAVRKTGNDYLAGRSANTRQQLRRSDRFYERDGPIWLEPAGSVEAAHAMLEQMAELHQTTWRARGKQGSFALPFFRRFHRELIASGVPRREVALLRISCGKTVIGVLYNFVWHKRMSAYQSGFAYHDDESHAKPGLTCHHAAIRLGLQQGMDIYDFLAGGDRYKRSLAEGAYQQFWARAGPYWSVRQWLLRCRDLTRRQPSGALFEPVQGTQK